MVVTAVCRGPTPLQEVRMNQLYREDVLLAVRPRIKVEVVGVVSTGVGSYHCPNDASVGEFATASEMDQLVSGTMYGLCLPSSRGRLAELGTMKDEDRSKAQLSTKLGEERICKVELAASESEYKRFRDTLWERQALFRRAQVFTHIGHWEYEPSTGVVNGSDELYKIYYGFSRDVAPLETFIAVISLQTVENTFVLDIRDDEIGFDLSSVR